MGTVDGGTYTNEYLGISMVVPEGFVALGTDELAEQYNNGVAPIDDGDGAYVTCGAGESYIDAYLASEADEAIAVSVSYLGSDFDLDPNSEEYLDTLRKNAIDAQGNATVEWEQGTFELEDYTFPMVKLAVDDGSGTVTHREILCLVLNGYSVNVEAISPNEENLDALLSGVTLLNQ